MLSFSVPVPGKKGKFVDFAFTNPVVFFAGSRYLVIPRKITNSLIEAFGKKDFRFLTGCAEGADRCFRYSLAHSAFKDKTFVACAFKKRTDKYYSYNLKSAVVVPKDTKSKKAALHIRTVWMADKCSVAVIFPVSPLSNTWGKGSHLAFRACINNNKPVFVVSEQSPKANSKYKIIESSLFGVVRGFWAFPSSFWEAGI